MKIVSWNCHGAFRRKHHLLDEFSADFFVIQECEDPARSTAEYRQWAGDYLWIGQSKSRGLGVFSRTGLALKALDWNDDGLQLFLPCKVGNTTNLVGVWTKNAGSPNFGYIGQLWKYLQIHKNAIASYPTIICGDFNSNKIWDEWDRWWNHTDVVRELEEVGVYSLYHRATTENQGNESTPTLFMYRKAERPYHIDYAFASHSIIDNTNESIIVGRPDIWLEYSDHMPLIFTVLG